MTVKGVMDLYPGHAFYITIFNFGEADVHPLNHQNVGEVTEAPVEIFHIKDERACSPPGEHANNSDNSAHSIHYKPSPDHFEQTAAAQSRQGEERIEGQEI